MKILHINTEIDRGGAANVVQSLRLGLKENSIDSSVLVKEENNSGKNIFSIRKKNFFHKKVSFYSKFFLKKDLPSFLLYSARDIYRKLISNDISFFCNKKRLMEVSSSYDLVHIHNLHGNYFNLKDLEQLSLKKPALWTIHDMWPFTGHCAHSLDCEKWEKGCDKCPYLKNYPPLIWDNTKKLFNIKKRVYKRTNITIVSPSMWMSDKLSKSILKEKRVELIHHGIDSDIFYPGDRHSARTRLGLLPEKKIILFVANMGAKNPWKGIEVFKNIALELKKEALFLCVGGDSAYEKDNVLYIPYITQKNVLADYYRAADIFLNTSMAESFSLVLVEALASNLPVVSFPVGVAEEFIEHKKNGYLSESGNENDLLEGVKYFLQKEKILFISNIDRYSNKEMFKKYISIYKELIENFTYDK